MEWVECLPPGDMLMSRPGLLPRDKSMPEALTQPWSMLMSMTAITTGG